MSYTDKKYTWKKITNANASPAVKAAEIFKYVHEKYPNATLEGKCITVTIRNIKFYLAVYAKKRNGQYISSIDFRYSNSEDVCRIRSIERDGLFYGYVKETYPYADGTSRIDVDTVFSKIESMSIKLAEVAKTKQQKELKEQLQSMKLVGFYSMYFNNDEYYVKKSPEIYRKYFEVKRKENNYAVGYFVYDEEKQIHSFTLGYGSVIKLKDEEMEDFASKIIPVFKYVKQDY